MWGVLILKVVFNVKAESDFARPVAR